MHPLSERSRSAPFRAGSLAAICAVAITLLAGCALEIAERAAAGDRSDERGTVIVGRLDYTVDGQDQALYDRPGWPAPRFLALNLDSGHPHAFGPAATSDGRFRLRVPPGAYVVSRFGVLDTDGELIWPRVVLCVPRSSGAVVHVGTLNVDADKIFIGKEFGQPHCVFAFATA